MVLECAEFTVDPYLGHIKTYTVPIISTEEIIHKCRVGQNKET
jgi:hypothetical protein